MSGTLLWTVIADWLLLGSLGVAVRDRQQSASVGMLLSWAAGVVLAVGAATGPAATWRLLLMAAVAAPRLRRAETVWERGLALSPSLALTGATLVWLLRHVATAAVEAAPATPLLLAVTVCGGLGARAVGATLAALVAPAVKEVRRPGTDWSAAYLALTLLDGWLATAALTSHGFLGEWAGVEGGLTAAWLLGSTAYLLSEERWAGLRATLTGLAGLLLVGIAVWGF